MKFSILLKVLCFGVLMVMLSIRFLMCIFYRFGWYRFGLMEVIMLGFIVMVGLVMVLLMDCGFLCMFKK